MKKNILRTNRIRQETNPFTDFEKNKKITIFRIFLRRKKETYLIFFYTDFKKKIA